MEFDGTIVSKRPDVFEKVSRRRYSKEYPEQMVHEANRCSAPEELGALLCPEGVYSGAMNRW
jgi:hypothetical protein